MVMSMFAADDTLVSKAVKKSLLAITYNKKQKVDPFATAKFRFNERGANFKFYKFSGNMYIYMADTTTSKKSGRDWAITVTQLPRETASSPGSLAEIMAESYEKNGLTDKVLKNEATIQVNGNEAYEVEIYGNMKGRKAAFYELLVMNGEVSVAIQGVAPSDAQNAMVEFRKFARTITFK